MTLKIPLSRPDISDRERALVQEVMAGDFLSQGPMLARFEEAVARYTGLPHAVAVSSGTAGLHLCIKAAGLGPGDEVITTPFSFVASANCILYEGATPVFADVDPDTLNIDPAAVAEAITPRTRAILPVHIFGQPADMDPIAKLAKRHGLTVIEDACEAVGAEYRGQKVGTFGDAAVFAFYPNKQMTTGEGGVIVTRDPKWASLFRSLRNQGRDEGDEWLQHSRLGYNYRLNELSCALGVAQVERLDSLLAQREQVARWYNLALSEMESVIRPQVADHTTRMSWFVYVIRLAQGSDRDKVAQALKGMGIPTRPYFPCIHLQPFYRERFGFRPGRFPVAEEASRAVLALPLYSRMTKAEVDYVCRRLDKALAEARR